MIESGSRGGGGGGMNVCSRRSGDERRLVCFLTGNIRHALAALRSPTSRLSAV